MNKDFDNKLIQVNADIESINLDKENDIFYYSLNNVDQCWQCINKVSFVEYPFDEVLHVDFPHLPVTDTFLVRLPECKVADKYMTSVYDSRCRYFMYDEKWRLKIDEYNSR